jgi:DNA repair ATPase RecN
MENLKINKISLRNVVGIEALEFTPTALTIIEGENAAGKTSILAGIQDMIKGGYDASLIREGQKAAETVLVIGDDEFRKAVGKTQRLTVNGKTTKAKESLNDLLDALAANPIDFINASSKDQVRIFFDTFPIELDPAKLKKATGDDHDIPENANAFDMLKRIEAAYTSDRKAVNKERDGKKATIGELTNTLPPEAHETAAADLAQARKKKEELQGDLTASHGRIKSLLDSEAKEITTELDETIATLRANAAAKIKAKKDEANQQFGKFKGECETELEELTGKIGELGAVVEQVQKAKGTRESIDRMAADVKILDAESKEYTSKLKGLLVVRQELLSGLPDGWTLEDNQFSVDGKPFHRLNTEMQLRIVFKIATLRAKDKPVKLICVDGLERLDTHHREAFYKAALKYGQQGYQFIVARVTDHPGLKVETR